MKTKYFLACFSIIVLLTGCFPNLPQPATTEPSPSAEITEAPVSVEITETQTSPSPTTHSLTFEMLKNIEYVLGDGSTKVLLADGAYEKTIGVETVRASLLDKIVYADLDGDRSEDAVVILVENHGGTGQFEYLVPVLNRNDIPLPQQGYYLGDRVAVNTMVFDNNRVVLDMRVHGPNDGLCCPSMASSRSFEYYPGFGFRLVHLTTGVEGSSYRDITLSEPVPGSKISKQFQVAGSFTISPFEATLVVRVMDVNDQVVYQGSIMAPVDNLGDPGTFTGTVDMSSSNPEPGLVRIEVYETSMADGTTLVMDSVLVILE